MSPICAPRCWISALVATVVPWPKYVTSAGVTVISASASSTPFATASDGSTGVEDTFHTAMRPVASSNRHTSVNVPPESTPTRHAILEPRSSRYRPASYRRRMYLFHSRANSVRGSRKLVQFKGASFCVRLATPRASPWQQLWAQRGREGDAFQNLAGELASTRPRARRGYRSRRPENGRVIRFSRIEQLGGDDREVQFFQRAGRISLQSPALAGGSIADQGSSAVDGNRPGLRARRMESHQ